MQFSLLLALLDDSGLTPEAFGKRIGVAGLTIRRWRRQETAREIPKKYETALLDATNRMITEGKLDPQAPSVQELLRGHADLSIQTALSSLGVTLADLQSDGKRPEALERLLTRIGDSEPRRAQVLGATRTLAFFRSLGRSWATKIAVLKRVIHEKELSLADKLVAYGALFYLITPFDLIPDHLPVIGLLDDYAVLLVAVAYYSRRFAHLRADAEQAAGGTP